MTANSPEPRRLPPDTAPPVPAEPIPKATLYLWWPTLHEMIEAREVTWKYVPFDTRYRRWWVWVSFLRPRHRKPSRFRIEYPYDVVVLDGWGHPDLQPIDPVTEICFMPGMPLVRPRDEHFAAWLDDYLTSSGAGLLADFRNPEG